MIEQASGRVTDAQEVLEATRAEFRDILLPADSGEFPRSATLRALMSGRALPILTLLGVAVLATRPGVAGRLTRAAPLINLLRQLAAPGR
jgi:hypothetical protein